jgi:hypothetical protein
METNPRIGCRQRIDAGPDLRALDRAEKNRVISSAHVAVFDIRKPL